MKKLLIFVALLAACVQQRPLAPATGPRSTEARADVVVLKITNGFTGTALVNLYLLHTQQGVRPEQGVKRKLLTVMQQHDKVTIPAVLPLYNYFLRLEAAYEVSWTSENLFYLRPGDCLELIIGEKLMYSGTQFCKRQGGGQGCELNI